MDINVGFLETSTYHHYERKAGFPLWTMGVCVRGPMIVEQAGVRKHITANTFNLVAPNTPYVVYSSPETRTHVEYFAILAMPREWERWFEHWPNDAPGSWKVEVSPAVKREIIAAFRLAFETSHSRRARSQQLIANLIERTLILASECAPEPDAPQGDQRVERAADYAAEHLSEPLSVDVLADEAGMSTSRFAHLFAQLHGQSPMRFVEGMRIRRAQSLLLTTERPIKSIAAEVGYSSQFHFADRFRACVGQSPSEYRARPAGLDE